MPTCQLPGITRHNQGESAILRYEDNPTRHSRGRHLREVLGVDFEVVTSAADLA